MVDIIGNSGEDSSHLVDISPEEEQIIADLVVTTASLTMEKRRKGIVYTLY